MRLCPGQAKAGAARAAEGAFPEANQPETSFGPELGNPDSDSDSGVDPCASDEEGPQSFHTPNPPPRDGLFEAQEGSFHFASEAATGRATSGEAASSVPNVNLDEAPPGGFSMGMGGGQKKKGSKKGAKGSAGTKQRSRAGPASTEDRGE